MLRRRIIASGLTYEQVLAAISYTGTFSASEVTYAASGRFAVIKFLTSGTLTLSRALKGDIFCVGGGAGGGAYAGGGAGGGYTATLRNQDLAGAAITVAAGGVGGADGGTSAYGSVLSAPGGLRGKSQSTGGGAGGSGGGQGGDYGYTPKPVAGNGGSDGSDGGARSVASYVYAKGQGTTTRAFAEPDGELFSGGGGGCSDGTNGQGGAGGGGNGGRKTATPYGSSGTPNTGGGGGGGAYFTGDNQGHSGGSGIVMIRVGVI